MTKKILLFILFYILVSTLISDTYFFLPEKSEIMVDDKKADSILYVGDIMLGRHVETLSKKHGGDFAFSNVKPLLFDNTFVIANLEGPLPNAHKQTPSQGFGFSFKSDVADILSLYHISAVSLANNHTSDQGQAGYVSTVQKLFSRNIPSFGHSRYFLSNFITHSVNGMSLSTFGINLITPFFDEKKTLSQVTRLCEEHKETNFIAFIHAGTEYEHMQSGYQETFAHKLTDETCVRVVIGSHPHVVQGIEKRNGKFIFYSLGNFIFDQYFSKDTQEGLTVKVIPKDHKLTFMLIPIVEVVSVPHIAEGEEENSILKTIASSSDKNLTEGILSGFLEE